MTANFPDDFKTVRIFQMTANFPDYSKILIEKLHLSINKSFRKDLNEFDAMVYEEGKLYERVLLQVPVYIFSFGISLLICGRGEISF